MAHLSTTDLESGLDDIMRSPSTNGLVELIVSRPSVDDRQVLAEAELSCDDGLVGDNWRARGNRRTADGAAHPDKQITVINSRLLRSVADDPDNMPLAGDQLAVDLDLSESNLPAGTRLEVGGAVIEVTAEPHSGCKKFSARFGADALRFVNSQGGRAMRLRGLNARVVTAGIVRLGDTVTKQ